MVQRRYLLAGVIALLSFFTAAQLFSGDVIKERKKLMKSNSKSFKAIKKAIKAKDYATVEAKARVIAANMEKLPGLFTKGSTAENSRAKAAIWKKWDSFTGKAKSMGEVTGMLADAAAAKDGDKVKTLAKGVRCNDCHKPFRAKKKKKKTM